MNNSGYNTADLSKLNDLVEAGKEGKLWTLTIVFSFDGETKTAIHRNKFSKEVMNIRGQIFQYGFIHPIGEGQWRVICPLDIDRVYLDKQAGYFQG